MIAFYRAWLSIRKLEVPTIAAINGHAIGAGLCMALACDLRFAAAGAKMGAPFVKLGLHPGMAATHLFPDVVGEAAARPPPARPPAPALPTSAVPSPAPGGSAQLQLVSRVFNDETFLEEVLAVAAGIAETAPIASRYTKLALAGARHPDIESALQWEALAQPVTLATADLQEGIAAARERRGPVFRGQ